VLEGGALGRGGARRGIGPRLESRRRFLSEAALPLPRRSAQFLISLALLLAIVLVLALVSTARAETPPAKTPPACSAPEHRQFDFWVGDWEVETADGKHAGTNLVETILGGCVIQEHWKGARGMTGSSFNIYDPGDGLWHQTWVDDHGTLLELKGRLEKGAMVLSGETPARGDAKAARQRITWTPLGDGRVRQLWESSEDGGKTWAVAFDGYYRKKT
jgi:hypothetical protein